MERAPDGARWVFALYLVLIVWAPIPLGSNRPWSWAVLELWILLLSMAWLVGYLRGRRDCGPVVHGARPVLICMAAWLGYVWLQLLPMPVSLLALISPQAAHWYAAAALPGSIAFAPISLDRYATLDAACRSSAYVAFFALSLALLTGRERIRIATYAVILSGVLQALYGAFTALQGPGGVASGTFVNRNHYAGYMVMCLSVGVGVLIGSLSGQKKGTWGAFFRGLFEWIITPKMGLRILLVTMVVALVLSRSRMGNSAFFISLAVSGVIGLTLSRHATRSMVVLLVSLIVIDVAIIGAYFGTQKVVDRISETTLKTEDRDEVAGYALKMWKDFPVLGSGLGSFASVFPRYSGEGTSQSYTHAHNDYVEFAAETGLIGIALLGAIVLLSFWAALRAHHLRRDPVMRGVSFAATMGILGLMIHSTADFNLQIPANALTFMLLLAFAWVSLRHTEEERAPA